MNKIYKGIIPILVVLVLTAVMVGTTITSARPTPPPTPTITSGIYTKIVNGNFKMFQTGDMILTNFTFTMPTDGYANVEVSGELSGYDSFNGGYGGVGLGMDNTDANSATSGRFYDTSPYITNAMPDTGFQTANTYYLTQGNHTVYLFGYTTGHVNYTDATYFENVIITVSINQNGSIQTINCGSNCNGN